MHTEEKAPGREMSIYHCVFTHNISQMVYYNYTGVEFFFYIYAHILVITCGETRHLHIASMLVTGKLKAIGVADKPFNASQSLSKNLRPIDDNCVL